VSYAQRLYVHITGHTIFVIFLKTGCCGHSTFVLQTIDITWNLFRAQCTRRRTARFQPWVSVVCHQSMRGERHQLGTSASRWPFLLLRWWWRLKCNITHSRLQTQSVPEHKFELLVLEAWLPDTSLADYIHKEMTACPTHQISGPPKTSVTADVFLFLWLLTLTIFYNVY